MNTIDSLFISNLSEMKDTLVYVAHNTAPIETLDRYQSTIDGKIAIVALVAGVLAAFFSLMGWIAQYQAKNELRQRNRRRPSFFPLVQKIYDDSILFNVIFEYDSNYDMSYTAELRIDEEKRSSNKKKLMHALYPVDILLPDTLLPEDIILLDKFEIYKNGDIYNLAFSIRENIVKYNRLVMQLQSHVSSSKKEYSIYSEKNNILSLGRTIIKQLFSLDESIYAEECSLFDKLQNHTFHGKLESDLSLYILSRFFNSIKFLTPEYILEDLYVMYPNNMVDFTKNVSLCDLQNKRKSIEYALRKNNQLNPGHKKLLTHLTAGIKCIEFIKYREDAPTYHVPKGFLFNFFIGFKKNINPTYNDKPLKQVIETSLGDIYKEIQNQIDIDSFDLNIISRYDAKLMMGTLKHNLLLQGSKQNYDNERRRIKRKSIWYKGKENFCQL